MNRVFILRNDNFAQALWGFLRSNWKAMADAGTPLSVTIAEHKAKRNVEQNKRLHAMLSEISEQAWVNGKQFSAETWKEHFRQTFIGTEEIEMPNGKTVERGISTTTLNVHEFGDLMEKIAEYAVSNLGVEFSQ